MSTGHAGDDPHGSQPLESAGVPLDEADVAVVMVHGRGATARSILQFADEFERDGVAYLAPQAAGNTWYPNSFLAPVQRNEPGRTSGLKAVGSAVQRAEDAGIPVDHVVVLGFSQGACLASEFVARNPRRYGGLVVLSGGLIGDEIDRESFAGDLAGTPIFLGCGDRDPHIPVERVDETATVLGSLGADVTKRIYEGMAHGVVEDEIDHANDLLDRVGAGS